MKRKPLLLQSFLLAVLLNAAPILSAHGFDRQVQELAETAPAVKSAGLVYTVGDLKNFIALRATPVGDGFVFFSMEDILNTGRLAPAYSVVADEARSAGITLSEDDHKKVHRFLRTHVERKLFADHVAAARKEPDEAALQSLYEEQKDLRFVIPTRMVVLSLYPTDREAAEQAWKRLQDGEAFAAVQDATPVKPEREATLIFNMEALAVHEPHLHDVLASLQDGEFSKPFEHPVDGWMIVLRQMEMPRSHMPYESVREVLLSELTNQQDKAVMDAFFLKLAGETRQLRLHPQNLINAGALAFDTDVMLSVGERDFTRGELREIVGWQLAPDVPHTERTFSELALGTALVQQALLDYVIEKDSLMERDEVVALRKAAEDTIFVEKLIESRFKPEITESELEAEARDRGIALSAETREYLLDLIRQKKRIAFEKELLEAAIKDEVFESLL